MRLPIVAVLSLLAATAVSASADGTAIFTGPAGWSSNSTDSAPPDPARGPLQWHLSGDPTATVTYLRSTSAYADALAAIHTNFTTNKIKPALDKDVSCRGTTSHVVEFAIGPDGHKIIINRMVIPMPDGIATLTYSRSDGMRFAPDVQQAVTAYCAAT